MPGPRPSITLHCPAKVNLHLAVGPPLPPDDPHAGMHRIASWMVALAFGDTLTLDSASETAFDIAYAPDAPRPEAIDWPLEQDLACRAHALMQEHIGRPLPVKLTLRKRIPTGAGLGGGSADAAGVLVGLNRLYKLHQELPALAALAMRLGSDVAFAVAALCGVPSAIVTGLGETVTPTAPRAEPLHLALVLPDLHCPTARVYAAFDEQLDRVHLTPDPVAQARGLAADRDPVARFATLGGASFNDLAEPAMTVEPRLRALHDRVRAELGLPCHVTGSGAALFVLCPDADAARAAADRIARATAVPCLATHTTHHGQHTTAP